MLFGEHGAIKKAQTSNEKYKIARAREKIELVLNTDVAIEKRTNSKYNQDDLLDELILSKVSDTKVLEDIIITDGYAFELNRSVPKLGEYIGKESDLVFPTLQVTNSLSSDYKTAMITINTEENKNGISKIEIMKGGFVLKEYTYENKKEPIVENFTVKQNGTYIVKVYSKLIVKDKAEINGLVASVEYSPNGNETYKKEHKVKVTVKDTKETVKSIKYQWLQTTIEPAENTFTENCNNGDTITKNEITGTWYLWILLETASGKKNIVRSEVFNFDNKGPTVTLTSNPISETSFSLTATATDEHTEIEKCEFYVARQLKSTKKVIEEVISYTYLGEEMSKEDCYVIVYDGAGNMTKQEIEARTKMHQWIKWNTAMRKEYSWEKGELVSSPSITGSGSSERLALYTLATFEKETGTLRKLSATLTSYSQLHKRLVVHKNAR